MAKSALTEPATQKQSNICHLSESCLALVQNKWQVIESKKKKEEINATLTGKGQISIFMALQTE